MEFVHNVRDMHVQIVVKLFLKAFTAVSPEASLRYGAECSSWGAGKLRGLSNTHESRYPFAGTSGSLDFFILLTSDEASLVPPANVLMTMLWKISARRLLVTQLRGFRYNGWWCTWTSNISRCYGSGSGSPPHEVL